MFIRIHSAAFNSASVASIVAKMDCAVVTMTNGDDHEIKGAFTPGDLAKLVEDVNEKAAQGA